jgi:L-ascorbate metabolism protein UlaG (beta-lactamase superfamily)
MWQHYVTKLESMKITKLGHCCMVIEENGVRILTDPGAWTTVQNEVRDINIVLITHEHQDHFHPDSLKTVLKNNPQAIVITNRGVGKFLDGAGVAYKTLEHGQKDASLGVLIEGFGEKHADIYPTIQPVTNTGYLIAGRFFYPGDAFVNPGRPVEVLALPVAGPWLLISQVIDYALLLKPKICFPVHDGMLKILGPFHMLPQKILEANQLKFIVPEETMEF